MNTLHSQRRGETMFYRACPLKPEFVSRGKKCLKKMITVRPSLLPGSTLLEEKSTRTLEPLFSRQTGPGPQDLCCRTYSIALECRYPLILGVQYIVGSGVERRPHTGVRRIKFQNEVYLGGGGIGVVDALYPFREKCIRSGKQYDYMRAPDAWFETYVMFLV